MYYGLAFCFSPFFIHTHNITLDHARHSKAPRDEAPRDGQGAGVLRRGVVEGPEPHLRLRRLPMRTIIRRRQLVVEMGSQLRRAGLRHVVCWRSEVQDTTAHDFAVNFYKSLSQEPTQAPNFERAFTRAVARMGGAAGASASRAPQRHLGSGAVDFVCLLSENGDKYPSSGHSRS